MAVLLKSEVQAGDEIKLPAQLISFHTSILQLLLLSAHRPETGLHPSSSSHACVLLCKCLQMDVTGICASQ